MAIDKTKIHCPRCGCEYEIDPGIYSNRESIECVCGRKWRANPAMEELCITELKPYPKWSSAWVITLRLFLLLLFVPLFSHIIAIWLWVKYKKQSKILRDQQTYLQGRIQMKTDSPLLIKNIKILRENADEAQRRMEAGRVAFWFNLVIATLFFGLFFPGFWLIILCF